MGQTIYDLKSFFVLTAGLGTNWGQDRVCVGIALLVLSAVAGEDNLRRVELGILPLPESADLATFLLSDGKTEVKPKLATIRTLSQLFDSHLASFPAGSIKENTLRTMRIHIKVLKRILGESFPCPLHLFRRGTLSSDGLSRTHF